MDELEAVDQTSRTIPINGNTYLFDLEVRNKRAEKVIADYASGHTKADVAVGLIGTFIPGGTIPALIASISMQSPLVYQPMARKLSEVYASSTDVHTDNLVRNTALIGMAGDLAVEFTTEFFAEIAIEVIQEAGLGMFASFIPGIGGIVGAGLDAMIAATLTWRVGTMISAYYQNGAEWVENRANTYHIAKKMVGHLSPRISNRVRLDDIPYQNEEILEFQLEEVGKLIRMLLMLSSNNHWC